MKLLLKHWVFGLVVMLHGWLITKLVFFPYPELFVYPYLRNIGLKPYGQIFDQHFPGLMFLPINLNNLGMTNEVIARYWAIGVVVIVQLILYLVSIQLFKSRIKSVLVCFLYMVWQPFFEGWVLWIDSFLPIFLLAAFWFSYQSLVNKGKRAVFLAGLFLGLAIVFKQVVIPVSFLVGLSIWWYRRNFLDLGIFCLGLLPAPILMVCYFLSIGVLGDFWYWTVTFNLTTFAQYGKKAPVASGLVKIGGVFMPTLGVFLIENKLAVCLLVYIIGGLAAIYARFDFVHLQSSLPFVMIATVLVFDKIYKRALGKWLIAIYVLITVSWLIGFYRGHVSSQVIFFDQQSKQIVNRIEDLTTPGQEIFLWGTPFHWYALSQTVPAGRIFVFQFPWFLMVSQDRVLGGLEQSQPKLILRDSSVTMDERGMRDVAPKIDKYIEDNYRSVEKIGTTEFMIQK